MTSIAVINTKAPFGSANGQESLDLALAGGSFGQQISLFFVDDGVFQLVKSQSPDNIEHRNYNKTFSALEFYDIENIFVCERSLSKRGLNQESLSIEVMVVSNEQLHNKIQQHQHCLRF